MPHGTPSTRFLLPALPVVILLGLLGCDGSSRARRGQGSDGGGSTPAPVFASPAAQPLRRSAQDAADAELRADLEASLPALVSEVHPTLHRQANGDLVISVASVSDEKTHAYLAEALGRLGFNAPAPSPERVARFQRTVQPAQWPDLLKALREERGRATAAFETCQARLRAMTHPGVTRLNDEAVGSELQGGRLTYTGHPLDLAMPDAGHAKRPRWFLPIVLNTRHEALKAEAGSLAYVRGGRLFVNEDGYLSTRAGPLAGKLSPVPAGAEQVLIRPDGEVTAIDEEGQTETLGHLALAELATPSGDGHIFLAGGLAEKPPLVRPGHDGTPRLLIGHLEWPRVDTTQLKQQAGQYIRVWRLVNGIELALAEPAPAAGVDPTPVTTNPGDGPKPEVNTQQLEIVADLELSTLHLKELGIQVPPGTGRTTIVMGQSEAQRRALQTALDKVLQGLKRRMTIAQQNYNNARRLRDDQNNLNPYRRKMVKIGNDGEILEVEDPSPFPTEAKPDDPNARPDGRVYYPNVNRQVEEADFHRAREEYLLIRETLQRLAPNTIYPSPPMFAPAAKAP